MANGRDRLLQHLELAAAAYGDDLPLPRGEAWVRPAAVAAPAPVPAPPPTPAAASPRPEPAPAPQKAPGPDALQGPPATAPATADLDALRTEVLRCTRCKLHAGRTTVVFGEGNPKARVMFIGEAPGAQEDRTGRPFVGPAGQLLDKILENAMGLRRSDVYIANINKCRPPDNRVPEADEVAACLPYLRAQVELIRPEVIVCLGRTAAQNLLGTTASTTALRGQRLVYADIPVVVTWHPAYLLREPSHKRETWDDIKRVNRLLGRPEVPPSAGT
jgi:DNA polymerase